MLMMENAQQNAIKCVVWDLDNTLWDGVLLEGDAVTLKPGIVEILRALDERGILHSIASRNNADAALAKLREFDVARYFLAPQIAWNAKSVSISAIQQALNIGMNALLVLDDEAYERAEITSAHPEVTCLDAAEYRQLLSHPRLCPPHVTTESATRRVRYRQDFERTQAEAAFQGPKAEFLRSLRMRLRISEARPEDLPRVAELLLRSHQFNATGRIYEYDELNAFSRSESHALLVCELSDRFGSYGTIGAALLEISADAWRLRQFLVSCRVLSRGIGTVWLSWIMQRAKQAGKRLLADFTRSENNSMMLITYRFANFIDIETHDDGRAVFENDLSRIQPCPAYIRIDEP